MIITIHIKGDVQSPSNYRPITLLSSIGKLFTKIVSKRLTEWAEDHALLTGFRPTYSTTDANYTLYSLVNSIRKKRKLYCLFIDFSTAFDSVDRAILYDCLTESGISSKMLKIIIALYSNTSSCVKLNHVCSGTFLLHKGLRQGDGLSPVLFIFYINKLAGRLSKMIVVNLLIFYSMLMTWQYLLKVRYCFNRNMICYKFTVRRRN